MPVTRSVGTGRQSSRKNESSSSAAVTETTESSGTTEASTATATTGATTATETTTTSEATDATETSVATESSTRTAATNGSKTTPAAQLAAATGIMGSTNTLVDRTGAASNNVKEFLPPPSRASSHAGRKPAGSSTHSRSKAYRVAKAKEELLRLQVEHATARLALLEADSEDEEDVVSVCTKESLSRVDNWLNQSTQPILAITSEPHRPSPVVKEQEEPKRVETEPQHHHQATQNFVEQKQTPAPVYTPAGDFQRFADTIAAAVREGNRTRYTELPIFSGAYQDWLPFRAAYFETEKFLTKIENLNRLRRNLKGPARTAVEGQLFSVTDPSSILATLEARFGRSESIAVMELDTLRHLPRLTESPGDICVFASKVTNAVSTLQALRQEHYLFNPEVTNLLVEKMTPFLRFEFFKFVKTRPHEEPHLVKFDNFMKNMADLCGSFAKPETVSESHPMKAQDRRRQQKVHNVAEKKQPIDRCHICEESGHHAAGCEKFRRAEVSARWDLAKKHRLCFRCLRFRTKIHSCRPLPCSIDGCKYFHHKMLHMIKNVKKEDSESTEAINSAWTAKKKQSYLKIVPVQVSGPKGTVDSFALLDDGSTVTLIDSGIAEEIGAKGPIDPLRIEAINAMKTAENKSRRVTIGLRGNNDTTERVEARTVKNLQVSPQEVSRQLIQECSHLRDISDYISYEKAKPRILIGQDNWHLLVSTKMKKGAHHQPVASLTPLGWVLHGSHTRSMGRRIDFVSHIASPDDDIEKMVKQYFKMDALCIEPKKPKSDPEEQALRILEKHTVQNEDGRYETSLLWKKEEIQLPNNYENSLRRLHSIEKKLDRDPHLKTRYNQQMEALVEKGYAEPAPKKSGSRTWYLPHFAVINPMKPEKLRVVHDAAAKTRGVSLNDTLYTGPDLLQSLPGVIMRFRQHPIAVTADIAEMFMQVKLREEDRDALRYLWRKNRRDEQPPEEYRMTSLIFGASSSPSTAIYVKNLNAQKFQDSHPEAAAAIEKKHYVDDYLDSFTSIEDAIRITSAVREIHRSARFDLKQWKSNSPQLLEALGENKEVEDMELYKHEEKIERVLGLIWKPTTDELTFNLNMARIPNQLIDGQNPTKREALRIVMSLFDPLGFASPVTIRAKQILQEVWRRGTGWDDEIEESLAAQWREWMAHLRNLSNIAIPRRYINYSDSKSLQLHVFTDASESSYSAVLYWRTVTSDGKIDLSLIVAKAKVSPLKLTSIPRLELQAAVMGARLAATVIEEHQMKPDSKTFWTDSKTVLSWIKTGSRSYKPYVAHRIAAIEDLSTVNEWRWVPTKLNVADDATRDVPAFFNSEHRWFTGPEFLRQHEETWPADSTPTPPLATEEEKVNHVTTSKAARLQEGLPDVARFSNWDRLRYATARVLQFIQLCKKSKESVNYKRTKKNKEADPDWRRVKKRPPTQIQKQTKIEERKYVPVTAELLCAAEDLLMRSSQEDSFTQEISDIMKQRRVDKESRLHQLSVVYEEGTLKLRGRIDATKEVTNEIRRPTIIDGSHPTVKLWIQSVHRQLHHAGVEATVNECRQQYWVLRLRPVTRTVLKRCLLCRMKTLSPPYPPTGDLPACRLAHHQRPFTYTGVDYFGPMTITVGRSNQKRYVAIFTCLTTRAIHLEVATSLSTDSAVMALRRMIARRGRPAQIWSDNGTNLRGADRELRQAISTATAEEAAKKKISWRFIPPGAPFMGGAWERMVRSVKTSLTACLHERRPTEEVLTTLLTEVEYTVNSRPLTHVSVCHEDPEALTPNHFLLGGPGNVPTPGEFTDRDVINKSSWRAAQRLADIFWQRWLREYLPELQHRREPHGRGRRVDVGDLVQIVDPNLPRNVWIRGKVVKTFPGPDDIVRTVDIQTRGGVLRRPVRKLLILPIDDVAPAPEEGATSLHGGRDVRDD